VHSSKGEITMGLLTTVFQGNPNSLGAVASGGSQAAPNVAVDTVNAAFYLSAGNGWVPFSDALAKSIISSATAATQANLLTFAVPVTGLYRLTTYAVQIGATGGTLPSTAAAYTEGDTSATESGVAIQATGTGTNNGDNKTGSLVVNAKAGTNIVISSASAATLTYTLKARVEYLG
jgi:hypothetical protein